MAKRGHEINLASGVLFSPQQEHKRMQKARVKLAIDLTKQFMPTKGVDVEYFKRPSLVHEFHFNYNGNKARRSIDNDMIKEGGRNAACKMMESVLVDYDIPFSWNEVPEQPEPVERIIVDNVGAPPERERVAPDPIQAGIRPTVEPEPEPEEVMPDAATAWNPDWTIAQLKSWSDDNGHPVPSTITRKGDILEFIAREHSN